MGPNGLFSPPDEKPSCLTVEDSLFDDRGVVVFAIIEIFADSEFIADQLEAERVA